MGDVAPTGELEDVVDDASFKAELTSAWTTLFFFLAESLKIIEIHFSIKKEGDIKVHSWNMSIQVSLDLSLTSQIVGFRFQEKKK